MFMPILAFIAVDGLFFPTKTPDPWCPTPPHQTKETTHRGDVGERDTSTLRFSVVCNLPQGKSTSESVPEWRFHKSHDIVWKGA